MNVKEFVIFSVVLVSVTSEFVRFSVDSGFRNRIVGGENAREGDFPYQVSLRIKTTKMHFCGASIISNRFLLTAAHCARGKTPGYIYAVIGTIRLHEGGTAIAVDKITLHSEWNSVQLINDIALIRTAVEIIFSQTIQAIALPTKNLPTEEKTNVLLSGWGRTSVKIMNFIFQKMRQFSEMFLIFSEYFG